MTGIDRKLAFNIYRGTELLLDAEYTGIPNKKEVSKFIENGENKRKSNKGGGERAGPHKVQGVNQFEK